MNDIKRKIDSRLFSRVDEQNGKENNPRPISAFFSEPALVVLGEPGMGKTTSFCQAAIEEEHAKYLTIREFCPPRNPQGLEGRTLYLDGLDEHRAGKANGNEVLDAIIGRLQEFNPPKFRLSCRTADWFGELDKSNLSEASQSGKVTVIRLEPLSEEQILEIIEKRGVPDGQAFLKQARQSGIADWITNPQSLEMVLEVVSQGQEWPVTRKALFERTCSKLVKEHNKTHRKAMTAPPSSDQLILAAGLLCTLILRADLAGIAFDVGYDEEGFPDLTQVDGSPLPLKQAAQTKLFRNPAPERVSYYHRTMAEYLAAHFLVHQIDQGLPAERVRRLLTSKNGLVPSNLRGLHAWVTTLCPDSVISSFIHTDPMGLILYGDPESLPLSRKENILDGLAELAKKNPWFRGGHWESHPLGRLADPKLKDRFESILSDWQHVPTHLLITVLDIIQHGKGPIVSSDTLFAFINNPTVPSHLREHATKVFATHFANRMKDLIPVFEGLEGNEDQNGDHEFRAILLEKLYPEHLPPREIARFLVPLLANYSGYYYQFLTHKLPEKTNDELLPSLIMVILDIKNGFHEDHTTSLAFERLAGEILSRSLEQHGETVSLEDLYTWLQVGIDKHGPNIPDRNQEYSHATRVQDWMNSHPQRVKELYLYWLQGKDAGDIETSTNNFWLLLQNMEVPAWFADWCLELAAENQDERIAAALFQTGIKLLIQQQPKPPDTPERAFSFVQTYPRFKKHLDPLLSCPLNDDLIKHEQQNKESRLNEEIEKNQFIAELSSRLDGIRNGTDLIAIFDLAEIYQSWSMDAIKTTKPHQRLVEKTSIEIALAAEAGFVQCLMTHALPSPDEIGRLCIAFKESKYAPVILSAMDLISVGDKKTLSDATLSSAFALWLLRGSNDHIPQWFENIITTNPDLAAHASKEFWLPQLKFGREYVRRLDALVTWPGIAKRVAIPLLADCPEMKGNNLTNLLISALIWGDRSDLKSLILMVHRRKKDHIPGWPQWAAVAYLLEEFKWPEIEPILSLEIEDAGVLFDFIFDIFYQDNKERENKIPGLSLNITTIIDLILFYGKIYTPKDIGDGVGWSEPEYMRSQCIKELINKIAAETTEEATTVLQSLIDDENLIAWRNKLRHSLAQHLQKKADKLFEPTTWENVVNVVNNHSPATAADLQALVVDHLRTIARELRDGNTDGYKSFWNLDAHGRTTCPIPEEDGRDRLLERLRTSLSPMKIHSDPEGHYADDKRADIKICFENISIPIEIKRDDHDQLWNAANNQLIPNYVCDPKTNGFGIYLVFWFGAHGRGLQVPPKKRGIKTPSTCQELEEALHQTIVSTHRDSIQVIVIDVSTRKPSPPEPANQGVNNLKSS
ncbi:MAG: hypothetical protein HQL81_02415 [Magnetococcales bacterium]|nr:hypothetical protein [Magnetococcales bacterium]